MSTDETKKLFTATHDIDDAAFAEAGRLTARGRKVRFVVEIVDDKIVEMRALDADPWAAGWQAYYKHREMVRKYMSYIWPTMGFIWYWLTAESGKKK